MQESKFLELLTTYMYQQLNQAHERYMIMITASSWKLKIKKTYMIEKLFEQHRD